MLNKQRRKNHVGLHLLDIDELPKDKPTHRYEKKKIFEGKGGYIDDA